MEAQNIKNHTRLVPLYHFMLFPVTIALLVAVVVYLVRTFNSEGVTLLSIIILLITISLGLIYAIIRIFPLMAQDRAIRAEENLRHFAMTGKLLDKDLHMYQIVALRFASDEEFVALAERAVREKMTNKEIKAAIKNRKADHHRV